MQAQDYVMPFRHHPDFYHGIDTSTLLGNGMYQPVPDTHHYFAPDRLTLNHNGFSRGSSLVYPHQELCRYFPDTRGQDPAASSGLAGSSATGQTIAGEAVATSGSSDFLRVPDPEVIPDYHYEQQWQWSATSEPLHGVAVPVAPVSSSSRNVASVFATNKSTLDASAFGSAVLQPAAQLPTPASMAILLNHNQSRSEIRAPPAQQQPTEVGHAVSGTARSVQPAADTDVMLAQASLESTPSREKKHGCTMCHKRFDRPSTLRKHLLVHTGEKAFVCDTCGRRFGVMSNLNRHIRRCVLKPVHTTVALCNQSASSASANSPAPTASSSSDSPANPQATDGQANSDHASSSNASSSIRPSRQSVPPPTSQTRQPGQKRRRRAPSPSRWIPPSLLSFNLSPPEAQKATPVPLPPVKRNLHKGEERDSWDENVASSPYHPVGWKDVLPGPGFGLGLGLGGKDVRNLNLGGNGGFMLGRVLVF